MLLIEWMLEMTIISRLCYGEHIGLESNFKKD